MMQHKTSRHSGIQALRACQVGFTLVELMVALGIVAILAALAVPMLTQDSLESDFNKVLTGLSQDAMKARFEAMSSAENRGLTFASNGKQYEVVGIVPGSGSTAQLKRVQLPEGVYIAGARKGASLPGASYINFTGSGGLPGTVEFSGVGDVQHDIQQAAAPGSVTIYLKAMSGTNRVHEARLVIFQSTGHARVYHRW